MNVAVRFFASLREAAGTDAMTLTLAEGAGYPELISALRREVPQAAMDALLAENVRLAVNQTLCAPPLLLGDGDEVAFLPPVTGG
jgi:sulfur-carrier protein